jgi:hypothetical protein
MPAKDVLLLQCHREKNKAVYFLKRLPLPAHRASRSVRRNSSLMLNVPYSIFDVQCSMFDVQTVLMIAGPQGKSHFSGANVFHHYHNVQIKVGILV